MGKQTRKTLKPRVNPLGARLTAGVQQGITEQQMTLQPDQVLPVVEKVIETNRQTISSFNALIF
jgi:hypothetical protein